MMGTYTEVHFFMRCKADAPREITLALHFWQKNRFDQVVSVLPDPKHKLFSLTHWTGISIREVFSYWGKDCLNVTGELRDYNHEVDNFIDWIGPCVEGVGLYNYVGYTLSEEDDTPTHYYLGEYIEGGQQTPFKTHFRHLGGRIKPRFQNVTEELELGSKKHGLR